MAGWHVLEAFITKAGEGSTAQIYEYFWSGGLVSMINKTLFLEFVSGNYTLS